MSAVPRAWQSLQKALHRIVRRGVEIFKGSFFAVQPVGSIPGNGYGGLYRLKAKWYDSPCLLQEKSRS